MTVTGPAFDRRATLLAHNAGRWEGTFVRLEGQPDGEAVEVERFASRLLVKDRDGTVDASLTNRDSGNVRSMRFAEPPAAMQISPEGHWSLGPERIGAWPWVAELCLAGGERRRRAVVRLEGERLISLVVVEARSRSTRLRHRLPGGCRRSVRPRPCACAAPVPSTACCCRCRRRLRSDGAQ